MSGLPYATALATGLALCLVGRQPLFAQLPAALATAELQRSEVIQSASRAAVTVLDRAGTGGGSAVVISSDGYALTNFHVVQPIGPALKCGLPDGRIYDAVLVGFGGEVEARPEAVVFPEFFESRRGCNQFHVRRRGEHFVGCLLVKDFAVLERFDADAYRCVLERGVRQGAGYAGAKLLGGDLVRGGCAFPGSAVGPREQREHYK